MIQDLSKIKEKPVFSAKDVAAIMNFSLPTVYEMTRRPGFPVLRHGKAIRIPAAAFFEWLNGEATTLIKARHRIPKILYGFIGGLFCDIFCIFASVCICVFRVVRRVDN